MASQSRVTLLHVDPKGNYWRESLPINDALLELLRFSRKNPHATCTIELREAELKGSSRRAPPAEQQRRRTRMTGAQDSAFSL